MLDGVEGKSLCVEYRQSPWGWWSWEVTTRYGQGKGVGVVGRVHLRDVAQYGHDVVVPDGIDAPLEVVAKAAIAAHANDFYSAGKPVERVLVENPVLAGFTVFLPMPDPVPEGAGEGVLR